MPRTVYIDTSVVFKSTFHKRNPYRPELNEVMTQFQHLRLIHDRFAKESTFFLSRENF